MTVTTPPAQETASATRSFSPSEVEPDGQLVVTIAVDAYGGIGQLTEEFPADFTFVRSSPQATRSGRTLTFNLVGDTIRELHAHGAHHPREKDRLLGNP